MMNKHLSLFGRALSLAIVVAASVVASAEPTSRPPQKGTNGIAVAFPWVFQKGTDTARETAFSTVSEILEKAKYEVSSHDEAFTVWEEVGLKQPTYDKLPSLASLRTFGKSLKAKVVLYGSVSWHTRSIWVNAGPKTISTATVSAYVYDVASNKVVYKRKNVQGRSDEKTNGLKVAGAILISPLVTAVSGGPATPQEQRAVQIALALAYNDWVNKK